MAGLTAARVLATHFERVVIVERDSLPEGPEPRKGIPQARHVHVLLLRGRRILGRLFPGFENQLIANGAADLDAGRDVAWLSRMGWGPNFVSNLAVFLETMHMLKPLTALFHPRMVIQALRSRPRDFGDPSACHSRRYNRPGLARTLSQDFDGACFRGWFHRET